MVHCKQALFFAPPKYIEGTINIFKNERPMLIIDHD
ncbi:hypothetical protein MmiEs2_15240 [Methanimicrococcus stummii]|uniref:Uncharacterized protein n=1 Tax=Methanimicrococcus stummii TaxID=3028294 RepID=A0AA96VCF8_9EURY|nr:hypothetical protein MmiEs2_15240 [Methanimicrococcus sp. Es2]